MLSDKEVVLQVVDMLGKWDIMLAGIRGDEILMVVKGGNKGFPSEINLDNKTFRITYYDSEEYLKLVINDENIFRKYRIIYFVKVYMRKILDLLASLEVERLSKEFQPD